MTTDQRPRLSRAFWERLLRFVEWAPDWDAQGAEHITFATASTAATVAEEALTVAPEPIVAPAGDGSLLLEWDLPNEVTVELYVRDADLEPAAVAQGARVEEVPVAGVADILAILRDALARGRD